jgi:hypothetical protein
MSNLEKYRNELTIISRKFYSQGSDKHPAKVKAHRKFLKRLLVDMEEEPEEVRLTLEYANLYAIIKKAYDLIKVRKDTFWQRLALNIYAGMKK